MKERGRYGRRKNDFGRCYSKDFLFQKFNKEVVPFEKRRIRKNMEIENLCHYDVLSNIVFQEDWLRAFHTKFQEQSSGEKERELIEFHLPKLREFLLDVIPVKAEIAIFSRKFMRYRPFYSQGLMPKVLDLVYSQQYEYIKLYGVQIPAYIPSVQKRNVTIYLLMDLEPNQEIDEKQAYHLRVIEEVTMHEERNNYKNYKIDLKYTVSFWYASPAYREYYQPPSPDELLLLLEDSEKFLNSIRRRTNYLLN